MQDSDSLLLQVLIGSVLRWSVLLCHPAAVVDVSGQDIGPVSNQQGACYEIANADAGDCPRAADPADPAVFSLRMISCQEKPWLPLLEWWCQHLKGQLPGFTRRQLDYEDFWVSC